MTEWFVEAEAELPWFGGWGIAFGVGEDPAPIELRETATGCVLDWGGAVAIVVNWNLQSGVVEFGPRRSAASSAT